MAMRALLSETRGEDRAWGLGFVGFRLRVSLKFLGFRVCRV